MHFLANAADAAAVIACFRGQKIAGELSYATVRDYCESADLLPQITGRDGDLKNVQRPWAVKAVHACAPPPARVLEIGGGEPLVSGFLSDLGYTVTLIDPYDGFGNGPRDYAGYVERFPGVRIVRGYLDRDTHVFASGTFDLAVSVSVLEHIQWPALQSCFERIAEVLTPGGASIHCFDFVLEGDGQEYAKETALQILKAQAALAHSADDGADALPGMIEALRLDLETFYLSPQGHNSWRGRQTYGQFPFRKVVSLQTIAFKPR